MRNEIQSVIEIIHTAGEQILPFFRTSEIHAKKKLDGSPVSIADHTSHQTLTRLLQKLTPAVPIISEEGNTSETDFPDYWLIDPLDGTKEFLAGSNEFCILIARIIGGRPELAAIHAPVQSNTYFAVKGEGAWQFNPQGNLKMSVRIANPNCLLAAVSRNHEIPTESKVLNQLHAKRKTIGSALKYVEIAAGRIDMSLRLGSLNSWDIAAADLLIQEAGGNLAALDSSQLKYRSSSPRSQPFLAAGRIPQQLLDKIIQSLQLIADSGGVQQ